MDKIIGVTFNDDDKIEYYYNNNEKLKKNLTVIVENDGIEKFAKVVTDTHPIDSTKLNKELGQVVRISTKKDFQKHQSNLKQANIALKKCKKLVKKYKLEMNIIDATYTFNQEQLIFSFYSDTRVDFRELAKELASIYKTRIDLHQIGVRDKAKKIGGLGLCGQKICCSRFINQFDSVSISMAKNQNLSLNPTKINGVCGRLLCCLKYENDNYKDLKKHLPQIGQVVNEKDGTGKVISVDIFNNKYKVEINDKGIFEYNGDS